MLNVGIVVLRFLPQALLGDAYWVWQNSNETEKRCPNLKESLHIQILLCLILFPMPPSRISGPLVFLQIFVLWKIYVFPTISSQLCSLQDRHNSIECTDTLVPDSLHVIYLVSISYHYFICSVCFLENIFLQGGIWFKPKLYGETRRMPAGSC